MSICAFDIGIKHLAYCILKKEKEKETKLEIIEWDLLNLIDDLPTCIGVLKNKKPCHKPAQYSHPTDTNVFYCKAHVNQYIIPSLTIETLNNKKNNKKNKKNTCCACIKNAKYVINTKYYCSTHMKQIQKQFNRDNKLCNMKKKSCMHESLFNLCTNMYKILDTIPEILTVDKIVIENQPALDNPTMKSVSIILFGYLVMKKHLNIHLVAPSGKLKINAELTKNILSSCDKKKKYSVTKKLGILYCKELLKQVTNNKEFNKQLDESKKKDDLCDAFLHAYYHFIGASGLESKQFIKDTVNNFQKKDDVIVLI